MRVDLEEDPGHQTIKEETSEAGPYWEELTQARTNPNQEQEGHRQTQTSVTRQQCEEHVRRLGKQTADEITTIARSTWLFAMME